MKWLVFLLPPLLSFNINILIQQIALYPPRNIPAKEVINHIGENGQIVGVVNSYEFLKNSKTLILFCGVYSTKNYFTIIIKNSDHPLVPYSRLRAKTFGVYGKIFKYKGKPTIEVKDWRDVKSNIMLVNDEHHP